MGSRIGHMLLVMTMVFATNSACFCWLQSTTDMSCHVSQENSSCCCDQEAEVADEQPVHQVPLLPSGYEGLNLDQVASTSTEHVFVSQVKFSSPNGHHANTLLRSPPNLFVLHATFLI